MKIWRNVIQVIWWRHEKASAKNFNAVSHNRARPEVLFSNLKHVGPCIWRWKESVHLYVSCCCKTCGSFQTDNAGDKVASQKPGKTVTPAFSFDCTKCDKYWTSNVVYLRAVKVMIKTVKHDVSTVLWSLSSEWWNKIIKIYICT